MWQRYGYTVMFGLLMPLMVLMLLWRSRRVPSYRQRIGERFGYVPQRTTTAAGFAPCIWLHAVSVGEVMAARPLVDALLREHPQATCWITTTTPTGSAMVLQLFAAEVARTRVMHSYLPYDLPNGIARFLQRVQPTLWLVMETEIWPNWYYACAKRRIPILLVNARLSARSLRGYARLGGLIRHTLAYVTSLVARSAQDADAFQQLGMPASRILVGGNVKFDLSVPAGLAAKAQQLRQAWGDAPVWVAGSTHEGEDAIILVVYQQLRQTFPQLKLVLVPRHPQRFDAVYEQCQQVAVLRGWQVTRRSQCAELPSDTAILLGDTLGELLLWYALADVAFIGGSLVERGGHNPLEAAIWGVPVVSGQHTANFADMFPALCAAGGAKQVQDAAQLQQVLTDWLSHAPDRQTAGQQARAFVLQQQGATALILQCVQNQFAHVKPFLATNTTAHAQVISY